MFFLTKKCPRSLMNLLLSGRLLHGVVKKLQKNQIFIKQLFFREKENKDKTSSLSKPRRKSDVIDSIGDNYESLKVASDAQDIHPYYSRHR